MRPVSNSVRRNLSDFKYRAPKVGANFIYRAPEFTDKHAPWSGSVRAGTHISGHICTLALDFVKLNEACVAGKDLTRLFSMFGQIFRISGI